MKPRSFRPRSTAAQTTRTSGCSATRCSIPSGAATRQTSVTVCAPAPLTAAIAAALELPVASIGSRTIASRSTRSDGSFTKYSTGSSVSSSRYRPMKHTPAAEHADTGAQHRADGDLLPRDARHGRALERRLDLDLLDREVLRRFVGEEQRDFLDELPEMDGRRLAVAEVRELVLDERMGDVCHSADGRLGHVRGQTPL